MSDWKDRVINELEELAIKIKALDTLISSNPMFTGLSPKQRKLLQLQHTIMNQYAWVLSERLNNE